MTDSVPTKVGRLIVGLGVAALGVLGVFLVYDGFGIGPIEDAWAELAWFVSPIIAACAAVATGVLLMVVAAFRLVDVAFSRAAKATGLGCLLAPVLFVLSMFALISFLEPLDAEPSWLIPWLVFALPIAVGIVTVLGYVWHSSLPSSRQPQVAVPPPD